jgi:hypothetical protein
MKKKLLLLGALALVLTAVQPVAAQSTVTTTLTFSAQVNASARLTISRNTVAFPDADPQAVPLIADPAGAITVDTRARTSRNATVTLTIQGGGDLVNAATDIIPIANISFAVTGAGFSPGAMDNTVAFTLGQWTGSGDRSGTQLYSLTNSWFYATGSYAAPAATYTLTAP